MWQHFDTGKMPTNSHISTMYITIIIVDYSDNLKPTLEIGGGVWAVVDVIISGGQRSEKNKDIQFLLKSVEKQCHLKKKL